MNNKSAVCLCEQYCLHLEEHMGTTMQNNVHSVLYMVLSGFKSTRQGGGAVVCD